VGHAKTLFAAVTIGRKVNGFSAKKISRDLEDLYVAFFENYSISDKLKLREMMTPHLYSKIKRAGGRSKHREGFQIVGFHDNANLLQLRVLRQSANSNEPAYAQATISFKPTVKPVLFLADGSVADPSSPSRRSRTRTTDTVVSRNEEGRWRKAMDKSGKEYYYHTISRAVQWNVPDDYTAVRASTEPNKIGEDSIVSIDADEGLFHIEQRVVFELPLLQASPQWRVASF